MITQSYVEQLREWPKKGRYILAQYDDESIYVYQAYRSSIAKYAVEHQRFGGEFSYSRMSWVKPNFLWMMYRSGWGTKDGQEHILAVRLCRKFFDELLLSAVPSSFEPEFYSSREDWKTAVANSSVRLQWDPDHDPSGHATERRAIQLGLRGEVLRRYGETDLISIEDITPFVIEQRSNLVGGFGTLITPKESVYFPSDVRIARAVGLDAPPSPQYLPGSEYSA